MIPHETSDSEYPRRRFLQGALAVAAIPPLCCTSQRLSPSSFKIETGKITVNLATAPELQTTGAAFAIVDPDHGVNLILIHKDHGRYVARMEERSAHTTPSARRCNAPA